MSGTLAARDLTVDLGATALAVARRLAGGATCWCSSPDGGSLPVGLPGARRLPWAGLVGALRGAVLPGDVAVLRGSDDTSDDVLLRAPAWGLTTVWLGQDDRPRDGAADHVLQADDVDALVTRCLALLAGDPAALAPPPDCDGPVCITCSDEGRFAEVVAVHGPTAQVRTAEGLEDADLTLVGGAQPHDLLVVHAGMALTRLERQTR